MPHLWVARRGGHHDLEAFESRPPRRGCPRSAAGVGRCSGMPRWVCGGAPGPLEVHCLLQMPSLESVRSCQVASSPCFPCLPGRDAHCGAGRHRPRLRLGRALLQGLYATAHEVRRPAGHLDGWLRWPRQPQLPCGPRRSEVQGAWEAMSRSWTWRAPPSREPPGAWRTRCAGIYGRGCPVIPSPSGHARASSFFGCFSGTLAQGQQVLARSPSAMPFDTVNEQPLGLE